MKQDLKEELSIPQGITVTTNKGLYVVKGPKGEIKRNMNNPKITGKVENDKLVIESKEATKREKKIIFTYIAHIKNMFKGVTQGHTYRLKICSGHFPMTAAVKGDVFELKNFIGEAVPRRTTIIKDTTLKLDGPIIIVESIEKEAAGKMASNLEQLTRRPGFDRRIFQDGIVIIEKDGKAIQ